MSYFTGFLRYSLCCCSVPLWNHSRRGPIINAGIFTDRPRGLSFLFVTGFQVNEVLLGLRIRTKGLERILESYLAIRPRYCGWPEQYHDIIAVWTDSPCELTELTVWNCESTFCVKWLCAVWTDCEKSLCEVLSLYSRDNTAVLILVIDQKHLSHITICQRDELSKSVQETRE